MAKLLIIGADGQLGQCLKDVAQLRNLTDVFYGTEDTANLLKPEQLDALFMREQPDYVINCAAYTAVDLAEDHREKAMAVNETGAANIAAACRKHNTVLVHISTDFVFEGNEIRLLKEDDEAKPVSVYGQTKLDGERQIQKLWNNHFIVRTSWLYSEHGSNFVKTMIKLGAERDELNIIADQLGSPTYAVDLAGALLDIIASGSKAYGIYHYSNEGAISWYDFAKATFAISKTKVLVNPIPGSMYPTKARRPGFSVMDKTKIKDTFGITIPYWRDSLEKCINK